MSIVCDTSFLECVYYLACTCGAWKRCPHTAGHDSKTWGLSTVEEFKSVPHLCRYILAVYEEDPRHPRLSWNEALISENWKTELRTRKPRLLDWNLRRNWLMKELMRWLRRQSLRLDYIKMFVLDEADEMRGLKDQIYDIFQVLPFNYFMA